MVNHLCFCFAKNKFCIEKEKIGHTPKKERSMVLFMAKKMKQTDLNPDEKMKYEIAEELGILDRVLKDGWRTLSAKETGRIGGLMTKRKRMMKQEAQEKDSAKI